MEEERKGKGSRREKSQSKGEKKKGLRENLAVENV